MSDDSSMSAALVEERCTALRLARTRVTRAAAPPTSVTDAGGFVRGVVRLRQQVVVNFRQLVIGKRGRAEPRHQVTQPFALVVDAGAHRGRELRHGPAADAGRGRAGDVGAEVALTLGAMTQRTLRFVERGTGFARARVGRIVRAARGQRDAGGEYESRSELLHS